MVVFNAITGLKRKLSRRQTSQKKRDWCASTVSQRMYTEQAMEAFRDFMEAAGLALSLSVLALTMHGHEQVARRELTKFLLLTAGMFFSKALFMLRLDSQLLDLDPSIEESEEGVGFLKELVDITINSFVNDDECQAKTRFTKEQLRIIIAGLDLDDVIKVYYSWFRQLKWYKFKTETLVIYMLRKMMSARTHIDLADSEFGGDDSRWVCGYNYIVRKFDRVYQSIIGPTALRCWAPHFPYFAEIIRDYICRDKERTNRNGDPVVRNMADGYIQPLQFNVFSFTDCLFYEICRPGSGPSHNYAGAPRRTDWYIKQRAFYVGYQCGMEACLKILTILLPN
jgi:hypothetical protein